MHKNMMYAHVMASLGSKGFYLDVSNTYPELISADDSSRLSLEKLNDDQLVALKNLAHDQYINAMLMGASDLESHRATLNYLSRLVQRFGSNETPSSSSRSPKSSSRVRRSPTRKAA